MDCRLEEDIKLVAEINRECCTWRPSDQELKLIHPIVDICLSKKPWFIPRIFVRDLAYMCFHLGVCFERAKRKIEIGEL